MSGSRPSRIAKQRAEGLMLESFPLAAGTVHTDSDSDGDTFKPEVGKRNAAQEKRRRDPVTDSEGSEYELRHEDAESDGIAELSQQESQPAVKGKGKAKATDQEIQKNKGKAKAAVQGEATKDRVKGKKRAREAPIKSTHKDKRKRSRRGNHSEEGTEPIARRQKHKTHNVHKKNRSKDLWTGYNFNRAEAPLVSLVHSLMTQEEKAARTLALMVLDGKRDDETYRWPVRELLPPVPKDPYEDLEDTHDADFFEKQGLGFVEELTGVPKTDADYSSDTQDDEEPEDDAYSSSEEAMHEQSLRDRKLAKQKRQERHQNEWNANSRLEAIHGFLKGEFTAFAQHQYRKGIPLRTKDFFTLQKETLPAFRARAARSTIGESTAGDEQEDELTPIQLNAARFGAEDALRQILDRLPYVIRQGALGKAPDYVSLGLPKPASSEAEYERGWDTIMTAASISGIDDRILKKVAMRMKTLLSQSRNSKYHEPLPKASFATDAAPVDTAIENNISHPNKVFHFKLPGSPTAVWDAYPAPLQLSSEFVDPLDPKHNAESRRRNARERQQWLVEKSQPFSPVARCLAFDLRPRQYDVRRQGH
ncbi:hypothetical protein EDD11_001488 [Mortierella claussenii]|nr:hypothetical protein EDD11_001488 [Mortierella claussenii]